MSNDAVCICVQITAAATTDIGILQDQKVTLELPRSNSDNIHQALNVLLCEVC